MRIWTEFIAGLTEDFEGVPQHVARTRALEQIDEMLQMNGKNTSSSGLPTTHRLTEYERQRQAIDVNRELTYINETYPRLASCVGVFNGRRLLLSLRWHLSYTSPFLRPAGWRVRVCPRSRRCVLIARRSRPAHCLLTWPPRLLAVV